MKQRKIQIGLIVLIILMCCGITHNAWAERYTWDGSRWLRGASDVTLAAVTSADVLVIKADGADLGLAGLPSSAGPAISFEPDGSDVVTLNVAESIAKLGNVTGRANGQYVLKAFNQNLVLDTVTASGGGYIRLKHNTGGLGSGSVSAEQLWADQGAIIYVDTMSATIGSKANITDAITAPSVVAANGGVIEFRIGNSSNLINIKGSIVTGANSALPTAQSYTPAVTLAEFTLGAITDPSSSISPSASTEIYGVANTNGWDNSTEFFTLGADLSSFTVDDDYTFSAAPSGYAWYAQPYTAVQNLPYKGSMAATTGSVIVYGTGTASESPASQPSFSVLGSVLLGNYVEGNLILPYTTTGTAYQVWQGGSGSGTQPDGTGTSTLLQVVVDFSTSTVIDWTNVSDAAWTEGTLTPAGGLSISTTAATAFGTFSCVNAALYIGGNISSGSSVPAGTEKGKLDLTGTETHFGGLGGTFSAPVFTGLVADSIVTDNNTSMTFYGDITDFPATPAGGRNLGSLYFKGSVTIGVAQNMANKNLTLAGNLEIADGEILTITNGIGTGTITVNGYVDLGKSLHVLNEEGATFVFNGEIRNWGTGAFAGDAGSVNTLAAVSDPSGLAAARANVKAANIVIGNNGRDNGQSVAPLPKEFIAVGNLTINRASCDLNAIADLTVVGNLTINNGTLRMDTLSGTPATQSKLNVLGNTTIGRGGVLILDVPSANALTTGAAHELGNHPSIPGTTVVDGALTFEGKEGASAIASTLDINGPIGISQGSFQSNSASVLNLHGQQSFNLPASIRELQILYYSIDTAHKTAHNTSSNILTLLGDLSVDELSNLNGVLRLSGYTLKVGNSSSINRAGSYGDIDATSNSTLDLAASTGNTASGPANFDGILMDGTTNLIARDFVMTLAAVANTHNIMQLNNVTLISEISSKSATANKYPAPLAAAESMAGFLLGNATSNAEVTLEVLGNLNIINNADPTNVSRAIVVANTTASTEIKNLIVHGDVVVSNNNTKALAATPTSYPASLILDGINFTTYGQVTLGGQVDTAAYISTSETTAMNILGEGNRFEFPRRASGYSIGKIVLNRVAGARFNQNANGNSAGWDEFTHTLGAATVAPTGDVLVLDIQKGDLNLNGNNITFASQWGYMQEAPGNTVINLGISYFDTRVKMPYDGSSGIDTFSNGSSYNFTRGAILSFFNDITGTEVPSAKQLEGIGVVGVAVSTTGVNVDADHAGLFENGTDSEDWQSNVRRYPKSVFIPGVGISVQRYYYVKPTGNATSNLTLYYDIEDVVGTENTMKFYVETVDNVVPTSDAFSNAEQLLGTTQVYPATTVTRGRITGQRFEEGKSYNALGGALLDALNGYLISFAALPGGGGYKEWTGAQDSLWQNANNWGPTPGAPGARDQAIIARSNDTIVITGTALCSDLLINGDDITIKGQRLPNSTTNAVLRTTGNIYNYGMASIKGVDGNNRLDLQVNDPENPIATGVMTRVYSDLEADENGYTGVWFDNVTVTTATLLPSDGMRISGNISLTGNSTMQQDAGQRIVLYGPNTTAKTLTAPTGNAAVFGDIVLTNQANMTTASSLSLKGKFDFEDALSAWESTDGTISAISAEQTVVGATETLTSGTTGQNAASAIEYKAFDSVYTIGVKPQTVWHNPSNARFIVNNIQIGTNLPANITGQLNGTKGWDDNTTYNSSNVPATAPDLFGTTTTNYQWNGFANPIGTITVAGKFDKIGNSTLEPMRTPYTAGGNGQYAVVFSSNRQTEISNTAGSILRIPNLIVTPNTKLRTNSSFNISNHLEVQADAEMLCNSGTITFDGPNEMTIINVSDRTLVMNNMNIEGTVITPSSWKLAGNLLVNKTTTTPLGGTGLALGTLLTQSYFEQTAGTITIQNGGQNRRLVDNMAATTIPNITFNRLYIDSVSRLTTGPQTDPATVYNTSFAIKNRGENGTMASGIELAAGSGLFSQPIQGTVYFQTDGEITDSSAKWITNNSTSEKMQFGNIFIAPEYANNNVKTRSSFEVLGYEAPGAFAAEFLVAGGGANFEALEGTVTFVGSTETTGTATISSLAPSTAQFASLRSNNTVILKVNDDDEIFVSENLIADGTSQIVAGSSAAPARVELNGTTKAQYLQGTTTANPAFTFTSLMINKGANPSSSYTTAPYSDSTGVVVLNKNATILKGSSGHQSELILARGVLNLNESALNVGAEYITYQPGYSAIDGAAGSYVIIDGHETKKLEDPMFTIGGSPTLYDLTVSANHQLANSLTVNNDLTLSTGLLSLAPAGVAEVIEPKTLTLFGDLIQNDATSRLASGSTIPSIKPVAGYKDNTLTRLILKGSGTVQGGLRNDLFANGEVFSITVARAETLGGDLTMDTVNGANLTIQTGVNTLDITGRKLILSDKTPTANSNGITIVSGNLTAGAGSIVDFRNLTVVPANMFARSEVGTINFGTVGTVVPPVVAAKHPTKVEIRGNVRVTENFTITGHPAALNTTDDVFRIYTGNNKLTLLNPSSSLGSNHYIVGNLVMPVSSISTTVFHVGNPDTYTPVTLQYGTSGTNQEILVTALNVDPTANRGGNPSNSINQTWTIEPQGAASRDSLSIEFGFPGNNDKTVGISDFANQFVSGNVFAAKWEDGRWRDYRSTIATLTPFAGTGGNLSDINRVSGLLNRYVVSGSEALAGTWAVFAANANTDLAKDDAISISKNKIVVTELATPVTTGIAFTMTIALQDQYNQPVTATADLPVMIEFVNGGLQFAEGIDGARDAIIPAGSSSVEVTLQADNASAGITTHSPVAQIQVAATGADSTRWTPAITNYFPVIPSEPKTQAYDLTFTRATYTDVKVTWTNGDGENVLIIAKANGSLVIPDEMPRNGVTYVPNMVYGAGSNIGDAVVLYNGPADGYEVKQSMDVAGLIPSTTYTVYAFAYNGTRGEESYNTSSAQRNPNSFTTSEGDDDDIAFGGRPHSNDSIGSSATVGTNAPIAGEIVAGDMDCFNFTVTDEAPNVRVLLTNVPGNYTLELYDFTGRRIRRSTLLENNDEALVVNNLPAGTFVVKVFPETNAKEGEYRLLINTFSSEIFSVTPAPDME